MTGIAGVQASRPSRQAAMKSFGACPFSNRRGIPEALFVVCDHAKYEGFQFAFAEERRQKMETARPGPNTGICP